MAHSALQNDSFCSTEWAISKCKMIHFEGPVFVKKIQGLSTQPFRRFAKFACTRPSDFYFEKMALSEAKNEHFVHFFHNKTNAISTTISHMEKMSSDSIQAVMTSPSGNSTCSELTCHTRFRGHIFWEFRKYSLFLHEISKPQYGNIS